MARTSTRYTGTRQSSTDPAAADVAKVGVDDAEVAAVDGAGVTTSWRVHFGARHQRHVPPLGVEHRHNRHGHRVGSRGGRGAVLTAPYTSLGHGRLLGGIAVWVYVHRRDAPGEGYHSPGIARDPGGCETRPNTLFSTPMSHAAACCR